MNLLYSRVSFYCHSLTESYAIVHYREASVSTALPRLHYFLNSFDMNDMNSILKYHD